MKCSKLDINQTIINLEALTDAGLVRNSKLPLKILGNGALDVPLVVEAHKFSANAKKKIVKAGGIVLCFIFLLLIKIAAQWETLKN